MRSQVLHLNVVRSETMGVEANTVHAAVFVMMRFLEDMFITTSQQADCLDDDDESE